MNQIKKELTQIYNKLQESPLRQLIKNENQIPGVDQFENKIVKIDHEAQQVLERCQTPVNVVFMGEVKSGKSTLLNCFAGRNISRMDVIEATASIISIRYDEEEFAVIYYENGTKKEGSHEDIYALLENEKENMDYFASINRVEYGLQLNEIREISMVDTPGIATVTFQNVERAESFIQNADVVIWVLNSNHLGQSDVEEHIQKVAKMGKPILLAANKIDEVDADEERIIQYIDKQLGIYVDAIYPVSAIQAYRAIMENASHEIVMSGFHNIYEHVINKIDRNSQQVQNESLYTSMQALLKKDLDVHLDYKEYMNWLTKQIRTNKKMINHHHERIMEYIMNDLANWVETEFLVREIRELRTINKAAQLERQMKNVFNEMSMKKIFENRTQETIEMFNLEWEESVESVKKLLKKEYMEFYQNLNVSNLEITPNKISENRDDKGEMMDGAKSGAVVSGTFGAVMAGYAAWLGPGAAYITLGTAMASILPPLLIAGGIAGAVSTIMRAKKQKVNYEELIEKAYIEAKNNANQVTKNLYNYLYKQSDIIKDNLEGEFIEKLNILNSTKEIEVLDSKLDDYINNLKIMNGV